MCWTDIRICRMRAKHQLLHGKLLKMQYFGELVLKQCTPLGNRELPGLLTAKLMELKTAIFNQFPQFWKNPAEFEDLCLESIQQGCNNLMQQLIHAWSCIMLYTTTLYCIILYSTHDHNNTLITSCSSIKLNHLRQYLT